jgi:hypothetical protein
MSHAQGDAARNSNPRRRLNELCTAKCAHVQKLRRSGRSSWRLLARANKTRSPYTGRIKGHVNVKGGAQERPTPNTIASVIFSGRARVRA